MIVIIALIIAYLSAPHPVHAISLVIGDPIVSDTSLSVSASVSAATSNYYVQGVLRAVDSSKYFGETKNNRGDWVDYVSAPEKEYITTNFFVTDVKEASWSGKIEMRFKVDDPNYKGPGSYELKLRRFTGGSSSSAGESNTLIVNLTTALPVPSPSPSPAPPPPPSPSPSPSAAPSPTPIPSPVATRTTPSPVGEPSNEGTVAGVADIDLSAFGTRVSPSPVPSASPQELTVNRDRAKIVGMIGGGLCLMSLSTYLFLKRYHEL